MSYVLTWQKWMVMEVFGPCCFVPHVWALTFAKIKGDCKIYIFCNIKLRNFDQVYRDMNIYNMKYIMYENIFHDDFSINLIEVHYNLRNKKYLIKYISQPKTRTTVLMQGRM